jgi:hypothetical protein
LLPENQEKEVKCKCTERTADEGWRMEEENGDSRWRMENHREIVEKFLSPVTCIHQT